MEDAHRAPCCLDEVPCAAFRATRESRERRQRGRVGLRALHRHRCRLRALQRLPPGLVSGAVSASTLRLDPTTRLVANKLYFVLICGQGHPSRLTEYHIRPCSRLPSDHVRPRSRLPSDRVPCNTSGCRGGRALRGRPALVAAVLLLAHRHRKVLLHTSLHALNILEHPERIVNTLLQSLPCEIKVPWRSGPSGPPGARRRLPASRAWAAWRVGAGTWTAAGCVSPRLAWGFRDCAIQGNIPPLKSSRSVHPVYHNRNKRSKIIENKCFDEYVAFTILGFLGSHDAWGSEECLMCAGLRLSLTT